MSDHLQKQIDALLCDHPKKEIRYRLASNDVKMFTTQCIRCGEVVGQWIPHGEIDDPGAIMPIDELLQDHYKVNYRDLKFALEARIENATTPDNNYYACSNQYKNYLLSPEWQYKRGLVLDRCGRVCEGCRINRATIVHHITYKHILVEFLFELIGVCQNCHDRLHPQRLEND